MVLLSSRFDSFDPQIQKRPPTRGFDLTESRRSLKKYALRGATRNQVIKRMNQIAELLRQEINAENNPIDRGRKIKLQLLQYTWTGYIVLTEYPMTKQTLIVKKQQPIFNC